MTFDDWLKDHFKYVLPVLKKRNLWWIFFISSFPLETWKILNVHKIHYLMWKYKIDNLLILLKEILNKLKISEKIIFSQYKQAYNQQNISLKEKQFKKINYVFNIEIQNIILNYIFNQLKINERELFDFFYMNIDEIKELLNYWNIIWSHTKSHIVLSNYERKTYIDEIEKSNIFLENKLGININYFAYPFWLDYTFTEDTINFLKKINIKYAFSVNPEDFNIFDSRYKIPRYDCILFNN